MALIVIAIISRRKKSKASLADLFYIFFSISYLSIFLLSYFVRQMGVKIKGLAKYNVCQNTFNDDKSFGFGLSVNLLNQNIGTVCILAKSFFLLQKKKLFLQLCVFFFLIFYY